MLGQNSSDDILVDLDAEDFVDLFCNSWTAKTRIASLHLDDGVDDIPRWPLGAGLPPGSLRREQPAVFSFLERIAILEQRRRTDDDGYSFQSSGLDEHSPKAKQKPIPSSQTRRSFTRTIGDDELVPHCQVFGDDAPRAPGTE